jgi:sulfoxide reductase catalytic subunit YedY
VEPTAEAKFVKFTSIMRPEEMPGQETRTLDWPYVEGLRIDEAMNELAIFATGMYGKPLLPANGAPFRLVNLRAVAESRHRIVLGACVVRKRACRLG